MTQLKILTKTTSQQTLTKSILLWYFKQSKLNETKLKTITKPLIV